MIIKEYGFIDDITSPSIDNEFLKKYNTLPKLFTKFFTIEEVYKASNDMYDGENISRTATDEMINLLYTSIFNYSKFDTVIKSLGFDGPDDTNIISCVKDTFFDELIIRGKFQFCVYSEPRNNISEKKKDKNFNNLLDNLDQYTYSDSKIGTFTIKDIYQTEDTYGISVNAIQNTDDTKFLTAKYEFSYVMKDLFQNYTHNGLKEFYAPLFLGDRLIMHDICNALGLSSAKKDEFIKDYYKNDENKLIMWAKRIKRKCPKFFDSFMEIAELDDDLFNENINSKGRNHMMKRDL